MLADCRRADDVLATPRQSLNHTGEVKSVYNTARLEKASTRQAQKHPFASLGSRLNFVLKGQDLEQ